ncbi:MAG: DUF1232 domain-containing protein [Polyangiaceae bacterium]|nr:DUF1232 domain-containing protein [Polyangiaceae bacterium]
MPVTKGGANVRADRALAGPGIALPPFECMLTGVKNRSLTKKRRGFSVVPFLGDLVVLSRVLRDSRAHWGLKLTALATLLYVVFPLDAVPEALFPVVAWVDDVGLVLAVRFVLNRVLEKYRYPIFEEPQIPDGELRPSSPSQFASG